MAVKINEWGQDIMGYCYAYSPDIGVTFRWRKDRKGSVDFHPGKAGPLICWVEVTPQLEAMLGDGLPWRDVS